MNIKLLTCIYLCFFILISNSVTSKEFDKELIRQHLQTTSYSIDADASAIVLYENTSIELSYLYNSLRKKYTYHKLVKILKADALHEADVHLWYKENYFGKAQKIKGATYNLSGTEVLKDEIEKDDILEKDIAKRVNTVSFSLPSVRIGSVIEYSYEIYSTSADLLFTWQIQEKYPKLESVFSMEYPPTLEFTSISHIGATSKTFQYEEDAEKSTDDFAYFSKNASTFHKSFWKKKNIPAVNDEPFVQNKHNNAQRLEMQVTGIYTSIGVQHFNNSWDKINHELWIEQRYKNMLFDKNSFFDKVLDSLVTPSMSAREKTKAIYTYVRGHYHCNKKTDRISNTDLWKLDEAEDVNVAEINALLTGMLIKAKLPAALILMSTTASVSPIESFPVLDRINYIACAVKADSDQLLLDASDPNNVFGTLPGYCYNGYSWILGNTGQGVNLTPDLLLNRTIYNMKISGFTDSTATMELTKKVGVINSAAYRKAWAKNKDQVQKDLNSIKELLPDNITILATHLDNEYNPDTNLVIRYSCMLNLDKGPNMYLNTNLIKNYKTNPFKSEIRKVPVEFPCKSESVFFTSITLPADMQPDTLAQPTAISYNGGEMHYKKIMSYVPEIHLLTISSSFDINTTSYDADMYPTMKEFFQKVIDNSNEMITIKRKYSK